MPAIFVLENVPEYRLDFVPVHTIPFPRNCSSGLWWKTSSQYFWRRISRNLKNHMDMQVLHFSANQTYADSKKNLKFLISKLFKT